LVRTPLTEGESEHDSFGRALFSEKHFKRAVIIGARKYLDAVSLDFVPVAQESESYKSRGDGARAEVTPDGALKLLRLFG
jgi:hypothetical protein